jgi:peptidoglycan-associated lipoprotein
VVRNNPPPPPPAATPIDQLFAQNVKTIYFDFDKYDIRPDQVSQLQANGAWLKMNPNVRFTIEGHCDEKGSQEYNLALGERRANTVKQALVSAGVAESRIMVQSLGKERPVCSEETEECFQKNRRAAFVMSR